MQNQALEQTRDSVLRYGESVGCELLNFFVLQQEAQSQSQVLSTDSSYSVTSTGRRVLNKYAPLVLRIIAYACPFVASLLVYGGYAFSRWLQMVAWIAIGSLCAVAYLCRPSKVEEIAIVAIIWYYLVLMLTPAVLLS
jgi:hypothetical protein